MLQGTLDVFSLDEVLGLLSGAGKTGVLNVTGDRGTGSITLRDGQLADGEAELASGDVTITSVAFELLRFQSGSFTFEARSEVSGDEPQDLSSIMAAAHSRLSEWRSIEAVVPSLRHMLRLAPDLGGNDVTINEAEWATIVAVGEGNTVGATSERLGLGEVDGSRQVKGLIERGLLALSEPEYEPASELPMRQSRVGGMTAAEPMSELTDYVTLDSPDQLTAEQMILDAPAAHEAFADDGFADDVVADEPAAVEALPAEALPANALPANDLPATALPANALPAESLEELAEQISVEAAGFEGTPFAPVTEAPEEVDAAAAAGLVDDIAEPDPFARRADDVVAPAMAPVAPAPVEAAMAEAAPMADAPVAAAPAEVSADGPVSGQAEEAAEGSLLMRYLKSNG